MVVARASEIGAVGCDVARQSHAPPTRGAIPPQRGAAARGQQPGDPTVAIGKGGDPEQAVMCRRDRHQPLGPSEAFRRTLVKPRHPARQLRRRRRDVQAHRHVPFPPRTRHHRDPSAGPQLFRPAQAVRQPLVELPVDVAREGGQRLRGVDRVGVDGRLHSDMRRRLKLEVAAFRFSGEVGVKRALDIDGARVVPLDQVAVVAVHATDEVADRGGRRGREASGQARRILAEQEGEVAQPSPGQGVPRRAAGSGTRVRCFAWYHDRLNGRLQDAGRTTHTAAMPIALARSGPPYRHFADSHSVLVRLDCRHAPHTSKKALPDRAALARQ